MRYYFLRFLSLLKTTLGYIMSKIAKLYNKLGDIIKTGVEKETVRIVTNKEKAIKSAKVDVIVAAQHVIELEQRVTEVTAQEKEKAEVKLFKLKTKVL